MASNAMIVLFNTITRFESIGKSFEMSTESRLKSPLNLEIKITSTKTFESLNAKQGKGTPTGSLPISSNRQIVVLI